MEKKGGSALYILVGGARLAPDRLISFAGVFLPIALSAATRE